MSKTRNNNGRGFSRKEETFAGQADQNQKIRAEFESNINEEDGIADMSSNLPSVLHRRFEIDEYLTDGYVDQLFAESEKILDAYRTLPERMDALQLHSRENISLKELRKVAKDTGGLVKEEIALRKKLAAENIRLTKELNTVNTRACRLAEMLETEIPCDLYIKKVTGLLSAVGCVGAKRSGEYRKGFYQLENVSMGGQTGTLKDRFGSLGLIVCGYEDESTGDIGLEIISGKTMEGPEGPAESLKIPAGSALTITVNSSKAGPIQMEVSAR